MNTSMSAAATRPPENKSEDLKGQSERQCPHPPSSLSNTVHSMPSESSEPSEPSSSSRAREDSSLVRHDTHDKHDTHNTHNTHKSIHLLPTQVNHVSALKRILCRSWFALDLSMLGAGKTFTTTYIANKKRFPHVVVICPVSVKPKWVQMQREYGLNVSTILGYTELRSVKCKQPRHGLLVRRDYSQTQTSRVNGDEREVEKVEFNPTRRWLDMVEEGVFLVFDEIQNIKNVSSQFSAAQALVRPIAGSYDMFPVRSTSRVLMLSGSPFDKPEQVTTLLRTTNVMKHDELGTFCPTTMRMTLRGMQDIIDYCEELDSVQTTHIVGRPAVFRSNMSNYVYSLFQRIIKSHRSSSMLPPACTFRVHKYNAFYDVVDPLERDRLSTAVGTLSLACNFDPTNETVDFTHNNNNRNAEGNNGNNGNNTGSIQQVVTALMQVETAKIGTFVRVVREILGASPSAKVSIHVNFTSTIADLKRDLSEFRPLIMNGAVTAEKRGELLRRFQAPSTECRLLIGNVSVCSTGIDLDDKHGAFPRFVLVSPNYSTITLYQLGQRFIRADTKSSSTLHYVFGAHAHESRVLRALATKSATMRATTTDQTKSGVIYPGDYPEWREDRRTGACAAKFVTEAYTPSYREDGGLLVGEKNKEEEEEAAATAATAAVSETVNELLCEQLSKFPTIDEENRAVMAAARL